VGTNGGSLTASAYTVSVTTCGDRPVTASRMRREYSWGCMTALLHAPAGHTITACGNPLNGRKLADD